MMSSAVYDSFDSCYSANQSNIVSKVKHGLLQHTYQFELKGGLDQVATHIEQIFKDKLQTYKINVSFGYILKGATTEEYTFFHQSQNNCLLPTPKLIRNQQDHLDLLALCSWNNILESVHKTCMTPHWIVGSVVCFAIHITSLTTSTSRI